MKTFGDFIDAQTKRLGYEWAGIQSISVSIISSAGPTKMGMLAYEPNRKRLLSKVIVGMPGSNGDYLFGDWFKVTCHRWSRVGYFRLRHIRDTSMAGVGVLIMWGPQANPILGANDVWFQSEADAVNYQMNPYER